jgi:hypothetical protein
MTNTWMIKATTFFFAIMAFVGLLAKPGSNLLGVAIAYFAILGVVWLVQNLRLKTSLPGGAGSGSAKDRQDLESRLAEIERRLTDVQDVMIALSEKFDRVQEPKI